MSANEEDVEFEVLDQEAEQLAGAADDKTSKVIEKLRKESARRRVENKDLTVQVGDFKSKLSEAELRLAELLPVTQQLTAKETELKGILDGIEESNQSVIRGLPEEIQAIVPQGLAPLDKRQWLDKAAPILVTRRTVPPIEGTAGAANRSGLPPLTEQELAVAAKLKVSAEDYAKSKQARG